MPVRRVTPYSQPARQPAPPEESFLDKLRRMAGMGLRIGGTLASFAGGVPGALRSGGAELAAELTEGSLSRTTPARVLVEAGLGAVPGAKLLLPGRVGQSLIRGGLQSGVGETGRELARGEDLSPGSILGAAATGGAFSGGLSALFGKAAAPVLPPRGKLSPSEATGVFRSDVPQRSLQIPPAVGPEDQARFAEKFGGLLGTRLDDAEELLQRQQLSGLKSVDENIAALEAQNRLRVNRAIRSETEVERAHGQALLEDAKRAELARRAVEEEEAATAIAKARGDLTPQQTVSERISAPIPGGKETLTTKYVDEALEDAPKRAGTGAATIVEVSPLEKVIAKAQAGKKLSNEEFQILAQAHIAAGERPVDAVRLAREGRIPASAAAPQPAVEPPTVGANVNKRRPQYAGDPNYPVPKEDYEYLESILPGVKQSPLGVEYVIEGEVSPLAKLLGPVKAKPTKQQRFDARVNKILEDVNAGQVAPKIPAPAEELPVPQTVASALEEAAPESALMRFFKSRVDASGQHYRDIKAAKAAGEVVPEAGRAAAGRALQREAAEAGLPTRAQAVPEPDWVTKELDTIAKLNKLSDETGAVDPAILAKLTLGGGGALAGAAFNPDDPLTGAMIGGGIGLGAAFAPQVLRSIGASPDVAERAVSDAQTMGPRAAAEKIMQKLPQWQRFSYLMSGHGVVANSMAGPYGSLLTGAIESGLSGDPRGWALLKELRNPKRFLDEMYSSSTIDEARQLIQRGEMGRAEELFNTTTFDKVTSIPGTMMTMGDVAARRLAARVGFSEDEARRMTLTAEPLTKTFRWLANFGKGEDNNFLRLLANMALPFKRTPANIAESGLQRLPGVGFLMNQEELTPEVVRKLLMQQGLSLGIGGLNYGIGANVDPETAKVLRRYMTNLGGRYSLAAGAGFTAGQATARDRDDETLLGTLAAIDAAMPVPTAEPFQEWARFADKPSMEALPGGAFPRTLKEMLFPTVPKPQVTGIRRIRRSR